MILRVLFKDIVIVTKAIGINLIQGSIELYYNERSDFAVKKDH